jgi:hypothetical protein
LLQITYGVERVTSWDVYVAGFTAHVGTHVNHRNLRRR